MEKEGEREREVKLRRRGDWAEGKDMGKEEEGGGRGGGNA